MGPRVGQGGEPLAEPEDLVGIGAEACHHGAGASARGRPLRAKASCFRSRRAWRWCWEMRSISRLTRRPLSTHWRGGGGRGGGGEMRARGGAERGGGGDARR